MRRAIFLLALIVIIDAPSLWGQRAVDVKRPEERAREQKRAARQRHRDHPKLERSRGHRRALRRPPNA